MEREIIDMLDPMIASLIFKCSQIFSQLSSWAHLKLVQWKPLDAFDEAFEQRTSKELVT